jgi:ribosomal subunit interface protein
MTIQVTGRNIEVGEAFQSFVTDKINVAFDKYIGPQLAARVRVEKERGRFRTSCSVTVRTGLVLEAEGEGSDAYSSADAAIEHLEKRLRRYKRRLKDHHLHHAAERGSEVQAVDYTVEMPDPDGVDDDEDVVQDGSDAPVIIAETQLTIRELPVSAAVMQLDLTGSPVLVFRNAANGDINVVYRRRDGHVGWIDPRMTAVQGSGT